MIASIKALSGGAKGIAAYFGMLNSASNYYLGHFVGMWFGLAAKLFNLIGQVNRSDFEHLLAGKSPAGQPLKGIQPDSARNKSNRVAGYDLTLSVPKSVSTLWAISGRRVQNIIVAAIMVAAQQTLRDLEHDLPLARRGSGGRREIFAKIASAMFLHTLSRAHDPNLHVHCVIANVCRGEDDKFSALNGRKLFEWAMTLGQIFHTHLFEELHCGLKLETYSPIKADGQHADWFELKCMLSHKSPSRHSYRKLCEANSRRGSIG